jgi:hypothetical protein
MDPITIMLAAQGLLGVGEKIIGGIQKNKAQKEFDKNKYEIPSSVNAMLDTVRGVASQRKLPGQEIMEQQIGSTTAQGVEAATRVGRSSSDALGALEGLYGRQMQSQQNLALAGAQNWQENQFKYASALERMGAYQDQKWQYNTLYPYMQKMTGAGQMQEAGNTNIGSAMSGFVSLDYANQNNLKNGNTQTNVNNPLRQSLKPYNMFDAMVHNPTARQNFASGFINPSQRSFDYEQNNPYNIGNLYTMDEMRSSR